jgi:transposase
MDIVNAGYEALLEPSLRRSDLCRLMFSDKKLRVFTQLPQTTIAQFLRVSNSVVFECQRQAEAAQSERPDLHSGRPTLIPEADEFGVLEWIRARTLSNDWPALREVKEQILHRLELSNPDAVPSKSHYTRFIQRVLGDEFVIRTASPLEEYRYPVNPDQIATHFEVLEKAGIASISLHLILNLDET